MPNYVSMNLIPVSYAESKFTCFEAFIWLFVLDTQNLKGGLDGS